MILLVCEKMKKVVFAIIIGTLILTGCSGEVDELKIIEGNGTGIKTDATKFVEEYDGLDISANNPIIYLKENEIVDFFKEKTGIVFLGSSNCLWSKTIIPVLFDSISEESIYYFNEKQVPKELLEILKIEEIKTPDVYFVKAGKIIGRHFGGAPNQSEPNELTDAMKDTLRGIYIELINKMQGE